jgi:hypothetical protein
MLLKVTIELLAVWAVHTQLHKFRNNGAMFFSLSVSKFIVSEKNMGLIVLVAMTANHTQLLCHISATCVIVFGLSANQYLLFVAIMWPFN